MDERKKRIPPKKLEMDDKLFASLFVCQVAGLRSALVRTADVSASESTLNVKPADVVKVFCLVKQQGFVFQSFSLNFN